MNRKLFNLKNIAMVAVFTLVAFIGFNSFKNVKTAQQPTLYWYKVTYDLAHPSGYIPSGADFVTQAEKGTFNPGCPPGTALDCVRGFSTALTAFPESSSGVDRIKKPN